MMLVVEEMEGRDSRGNEDGFMEKFLNEAVGSITTIIACQFF